MAASVKADFWPPNPFNSDRVMQTSVPGVTCKMGSVPHLQWSGLVATAPANNSVLAASAPGTSNVVITTGFTQPSVPRVPSVTFGGTAGDIKGGTQVYLEGTDWADQPINETSPVSTADTITTVEFTKAFKTYTKAIYPGQDGAGATISIGLTKKLGLPFKLPHNTVQDAYRNNVREGTPPTVTTDKDVLANNTISMSNAPNGTDLDVYLFI